MRRWVRGVLTGLAALVVGLAGVALFVRLGPVGGTPGRIALGVFLYLGGGAAIGALHPRGRRWLLAGLNAWSALLLGSVGFGVSLTSPRPGDLSTALVLLSLPLGLSWAGGWLGASWRRSGA